MSQPRRESDTEGGHLIKLIENLNEFNNVNRSKFTELEGMQITGNIYLPIQVRQYETDTDGKFSS